MSRVAWLALAGVVSACGSHVRTMVSVASDQTEYPCVLRDPVTLQPDFMVRQTLAFHAVRDGKHIDSELDAVVQKQGGTLLIVGLGPMNAKVFTLTHQRDRIEFAQFMGPKLAFSPRNVVVDVHRVYFKRLEAPFPGDTNTYTGVRRGELDGEQVEEIWHNGQLRSVAFTRLAEPALRGAIRIELGPGCKWNACEPDTVSLHNEWYGYQLTITNSNYERL